MKTNNLEDFDKELREIIYIKASGIASESGCSSNSEEYPMVRRRIQDICDRVIEIGQQFILNREKDLLTDIKSKIDKEIERWEKVDEESSSYKISALYDLRKKL